MRAFRKNGCAWLAAMVLACGRVAHAELLVGDYRGGDVAASVYRYGDDAAGPASPETAFKTDIGSERLISAFSMTFEPLENVVYIADFPAKAIRVYPAPAAGNAAALRVLNPAQLGQPRQVAISIAHDEMIVANTCCIASYSRFATGSGVYALRYLPSANTESGSRTRLTNPAGVILRTSSDEIAVPDVANGPDGSHGVVLFFSRAVTGNSAPYRALEGAQTLLGVGAIGITYDPFNDEIYVLSQEPASNPSGFRISVFAGNASGDAAPLRTINGTNTLLDDVNAIEYDAAAETLYVSEGGNYAPARVLAFPRLAGGNVSPARVLLPTATSFVAPVGITTTSDVIFRSGFN